MNKIPIWIALTISLIGSAAAWGGEMRPVEAAAEMRFEGGFGSPWAGGDSPVLDSSLPSYQKFYGIPEESVGEGALDPLPSWVEGSAKTAILSFVADVTAEGSPNYVAPEARIATFDNDGTLWCEYPNYVPYLFIFDRVRDMASYHPEWNGTEPFSSILSGERTENFSPGEVMEIYIATSSNMTADEYQTLAREWLDESFHPHFGLPYTECVYTPMLELLSYLKAEGFKVYIVTGGDQDFVRAFSWEVYGIPPEQVIGSAIKHQFIEVDGNSSVVKLPEIQVVNDGRVKAEQIQLIVGLRPILAYGNSDGDIPMLKFATGGEGPGLGLLNHHDDPIREYAYDNGSAIGRLEEGLKLAEEWGWEAVSMKEDWNCIF